MVAQWAALPPHSKKGLALIPRPGVQGPFCVEFACSPCVCVGFLRGLARVYVSAIVWNYPAMAIMRGSNGFIQGIGNARLGLIFALLDGFVFRIMLSYLFGILLGYGLFGFFLGYGLATYGTAMPGAVYFFFGSWRKELHV